MASNPFEGFSFSQNAATAGAATAGVKPRAKSPSHSGTPHKGHRASSPTADSSESIPVVSPQKRRRGNPEPSLCSRSAKGKGDQGLAQCLARENQLKQRLGGGLGEKLGGIAPPETTGPEADDTMPHSVGVGFTDVGTGHPGTKSSDFPTQVFLRWREDFYERMRAHMRAASESIGCSCGSCGAPALVAFSGKRHYMELLNAGRRGKSKIPKVEIGVQPANLLPPGWPFPASTQVIVCCSTSGASPMTAAERLAPYQDLASKLAGVPWPRADLPRCKVKEAAG